MEYNFVSNIEQCFILVRDFVPVNVVYYTHIPSALVSLFIGGFVFLKGERTLLSKILLSIVGSFSLWAFFDIILWTSYDSRLYMFFWSIMVILEAILFISCLYLFYVFIEKKDVSFLVKVAFFLFFLPILIVVPTKLHLSSFTIDECVPIENILYPYYAMPFLGIILLSLILLMIFKYKKQEPEFKKQVLLLFLGIMLFLSSFLSGQYISSYLIDNEIFSATEAYKYEFYGLFGMPIFIGFLTYLIVKYKAFNIKLLAAQALVLGIFILIGSQFFFIQNPINKALTAITLIFTGIFGRWLIRSVKDEIKKKEEMMRVTQELAQANHKLRKLDQAKTEFLSIASHQLRTPLTAIKGFSSLLLEGVYGEIGEEARATIKKIETSNNRLVQLTENLLNISRIESGRLLFDFAKNDIEEILKSTIDELSPGAQNRNLYIKYEKPEQPIEAFVFDKPKMHEVFMNIIDNAIKYTNEGGIVIKLENFPQKVRITFSDTGIGIPTDDLTTISTKFHRAENARSAHTDGTGIGMYVVVKIIEAHSGAISIASDGVGKGSTFTVELDKNFSPKKEQIEEE